MSFQSMYTDTDLQKLVKQAERNRKNTPPQCYYKCTVFNQQVSMTAKLFQKQFLTQLHVQDANVNPGH